MKTRVSLRYFASYCKSIEHFKIVKNLLELLKLLKSLTYELVWNAYLQAWVQSLK